MYKPEHFIDISREAQVPSTAVFYIQAAWFSVRMGT
jgi:hypothetical protein